MKQWARKPHTSLQDDKTTANCFNDGQVSPKTSTQDTLLKMAHHKSFPANHLRHFPTGLVPTGSAVGSFEETDITTKIMAANRRPLPLIRHHTSQDQTLKVPVTYKAHSQPSSPVTKTVVTKIAVKSSLSDGSLSDDISLLNRKKFDTSSAKVGVASCHGSQTNSDGVLEDDFVTEDDLLSLSPAIGDKLPFLTVQLGLTLSDWDKARTSFKLPDTQALYILRLWYNEKERRLGELRTALSHCGLTKLTCGGRFRETVQESTTEATEDEDAKSKSPTHRPFYSRTTSLLTMRPTKDHTPLYNRGFSLQREDGSIKNFMRQGQTMVPKEKQRAIMKQEHVEELLIKHDIET